MGIKTWTTCPVCNGSLVLISAGYTYLENPIGPNGIIGEPDVTSYERNFFPCDYEETSSATAHCETCGQIYSQLKGHINIMSTHVLVFDEDMKNKCYLIKNRNYTALNAVYDRSGNLDPSIRVPLLFTKKIWEDEIYNGKGPDRLFSNAYALKQQRNVTYKDYRRR